MGRWQKGPLRANPPRSFGNEPLPKTCHYRMSERVVHCALRRSGIGRPSCGLECSHFDSKPWLIAGVCYARDQPSESAFHFFAENEVRRGIRPELRDLCNIDPVQLRIADHRRQRRAQDGRPNTDPWTQRTIRPGKPGRVPGPRTPHGAHAQPDRVRGACWTAPTRSLPHSRYARVPRHPRVVKTARDRPTSQASNEQRPLACGSAMRQAPQSGRSCPPKSGGNDASWSGAGVT